MRDPTTNVAEEQRLRDAIEEARRHLARLALDITSWTDEGANTLDPKQERRHAIAMVKQVADNLRDAVLAELLRKAIPTLERTRPAKKTHGHQTVEWRDRNQLIVETIELVCQKYQFDPTRNPASRDESHPECGCSIVSKALEKLETQLSWFEKFGRKKPNISLSEKTIHNIWEKRAVYPD
jgi:hypothetical protein